MTGGLQARGLIVGLIGNALIAYALYTLLSRAGCAGIACTEVPGWAIAALPVGIILSVVGVFLGGGMISFAGTFIAVGAGSIGAAATTDMGEMQTFGWTFGGMFAFFGLLPLLLARGLRRAGERKQAQAMELIRTGAKGVGTITSVRDTGVTINDNPRVEIFMRVEPVDGSAPVERRKTVTVSRVAIPRTGERYPVWYDLNDPDKWAFGTDMEVSAPPEIKEMFARAQGGAAEDVGAPDDAVDDLERITQLWKNGALTDLEFAEAKARLLAQIGR